MNSFSTGLIVLVFALVVVAVTCLILLLNQWLGKSNRNNAAELPFECGLNPTGSINTALSVNYYLIACAFLIFELETALLFPWAESFWLLGAQGITAAVSFIIILLLGLVYLIGKGGINIDG